MRVYYNNSDDITTYVYFFKTHKNTQNGLSNTCQYIS